MRRLLVACVAVCLCSTPGRAEEPRGALGMYVRGPDRVVPGTPVALRIATHLAASPAQSQPLAGVDVEVAMEGRGRRAVVWRGRSDDAGAAPAAFVAPSWSPGRYAVVVEARWGRRRDRQRHALELQPAARLVVQSDKPLYQPGQTIHLRSVGVRTQDGRPLAGEKLVFELFDARDNRIAREERTLSAFGVAAADVVLADEVVLGDWRARVALAGGRGGEGEAGGEADLALRVERYVLPRFQVSIEPDRGWYRAGERARLSVGSRYVFDKPVSGGVVEVEALLAGRRVATLRGTLDGEGKTRLELDLPRAFPGDEATLELRADVTDGAGHRQRGQRDLPLAKAPLALEMVAEAGDLRAGVEQRVWVIAARPDGTPVAGADAELVLAGQPAPLRARTDATGVAEFAVTPSAAAARNRCGAGKVELAVTVAAAGDRAVKARCVTLGEAFLLRADRALYPEASPLSVEVFAPGPDGLAYVDVLKEDQIVDTATVPLAGGRGRATFSGSARWSGSVILDAYRVAADGRRQLRDTRLVHVAPRASLAVEVRPEVGPQGGTFRPGQPGRLHLRVLDRPGGRGVRASVGVVMVDRAVLALRAMRPGSSRVLLTLARAATAPGERLAVTPGGWTLLGLVEAARFGAEQQRAARILLVGAEPPDPGWELDPWARRQEAWSAQTGRVGPIVWRYARTHLVGERVGGVWMYRRDLVQQMVANGALKVADAIDPWERPLVVAEMIDWAGLGPFEGYAESELGWRMTEIYKALRKRHGKAADRLSVTDLEGLVAEGTLRRSALGDPWGSSFRFVERRRPLLRGGLRSRWILASSGPDRLAGTGDDLYALDQVGAASCGLPTVVGASKEIAFGGGGLGIGCGFGLGGGGMGGGTIGLGRYGTIGRGGGGGGAWTDDVAPVRRDFPETMLWRPEVLTDANGEAVIETTMADSVTTWKLSAEAIAADGRLGATAVDVRVFQDFFVDVDLPSALTQGDELDVPVAAWNYLPRAQRVTLTVERAEGLTLTGAAAQTLDLAPGQVGVRHFRLRATGLGRGKLVVRATGPGARDAVERSVEVHPDGVERQVAFQDQLGAGAASHHLVVPEGALAGTPVASLKIFPGMVSQALDGLDALLQEPHGCFEQTSSSTYPNLLVLDYLRRTGKSTPAVEKRARAFIATGYQRLLSFEVRGGGFSWFGDAPANQVLTAYGLEEFHDMARVYSVDRHVIERTQRWLAGRQRADGSFGPDAHDIPEGATRGYADDTVRRTAYIGLALHTTGGDRRAVERARGYVRRALDRGGVDDPYTLALAAQLVGQGDPRHAGLLEALWKLRREENDQVAFEAGGKTLTRGAGTSATLETTARVTLAFLEGRGRAAGRTRGTVAYLVGKKDAMGSWSSTQATIRTLQALLAWESGHGAAGTGVATVRVDGQVVAEVRVAGAADTLQVVDLPAARRPGAHRVEILFAGSGRIAYQVVGRWFEPRPAAGAVAAAARDDLVVETVLDRDRLKVGEALRAEVRVVSRAKEALDMPMVTAGLPPGFDVDGAELEKLVKSGRVEKVEQNAREVVFYLTTLEPNKPFVLPVRLVPRFPARVQIPAPATWEYYRPERRADGRPRLVTVAAR